MLRWLLVVAVLALAVSVMAAPVSPILPHPVLTTLHIADLAGAKLRPLIGHQIVLDGYYSDASVPMIVSDYNRLSELIPLPPGSYQPVVGQIPATVHAGDHVTWTVNVRAPLATDPAHVRRLTAVLEPVTPTGAATRLATSQVSGVLRPILSKFPHGIPILTTTRYAVLIVGSVDDYNNFLCFWNDEVAMYKVLIAAGYTPANIYVLYYQGTGRDSQIPVYSPADKPHIDAVFQLLAGKMGANDSLYVMLDDHGGGFLKQANSESGWGMYSGVWNTNGDEPKDISEAFYNTDFNNNGEKTDWLGVNQVLCTLGWQNSTTANGIKNDDFAADVNLIKNYRCMAFQMNQCFSGGFIEALKGPKRLMMSEANKDQCGWCQIAGYSHFFYRYIAALRGSYPDTGVAVNADLNHDGKVSLEEAYLFARPFVTGEDEPWYCDDGSGVPVDIPGQGNSQGALGKTLFLPL